MILVDIQVPTLDKTYDFELDEEMGAGELSEKAAGIIAEKEEMSYFKTDKMYFYAIRQGKILNPDYSLKEQGIRSGERLMLI